MSNEFANLISKATEEANKAGDKWIAEHTKPVWNVVNEYSGEVVGQLLDVCGFGYVRITDKRTSFAKYLKKVQRNGYIGYVDIFHKHRCRQELGLNTATATAIYKVLSEAGIKGIEIYSRID